MKGKSNGGHELVATELIEAEVSKADLSETEVSMAELNGVESSKAEGINRELCEAERRLTTAAGPRARTYSPWPWLCRRYGDRALRG